MSIISENLKRVQDRIARALDRGARQDGEVTLVAVSKSWPAKMVQEVVDSGVQVLGENRIQEAEGKVKSVEGEISWHLIGHLQRNKVRVALSLFDLIHSVDSLRLVYEISKRAVQTGTQARILVEVNTTGEVSKFGVEPERTLELVGQISEVQGVRIEGLMTMGAFVPDPEGVRPSFVRLRELRDEIVAAKIPRVSMNHLSMGMTGDFEVAIEEGATLVRVGTAIFGARAG